MRIASFSGLGFLVILALVLANLGLLRDRGGIVARKLGLANKLTLVRFALVVPTVGLLADDRLVPALGLYAISGLTDVMDGIVARVRGEETRFGVMMDPTADIFTTAGVFGALWMKGLVPGWVFAILVVRYASLAAGSVALHFTVRPVEFKATRVGKIVGVLQAVAVILIVALTAAGVDWREDIGVYLYPFLAMIFGWVIVSQMVAALRHIEKGAAYAGSQGGSCRISADIHYADAESRGGDG